MTQGIDAAAQTTVIRIVADAVGTDVGPETELRTLDMSSLEVMRVISRFEDAFGLRVPALLLFEADTVNDLVAGVAQAKLDGAVPKARPPIRPLPRRRRGASDSQPSQRERSADPVR